MSNPNIGIENTANYHGEKAVYDNNREGVAPLTGRFQICKHEKVSAAGANPERGWHPGHCAKCGLDMTIDSGD